MKHSIVSGILALSLAFSTMAFAKDVDSIDLFSGDYMAVAGVDMDNLATRPLYKKIRSDASVTKEADSLQAKLSALDASLDAEKDIDQMIIAIPTDVDKEEHVIIFEFKKSIANAVVAMEADSVKPESAYSRVEADGIVYYIHKRGNEWLTVIDDKRLAVGSEREVKAVAASKKAGKSAKPLKKNAALYKQYQAADKKTDIWGAYILTARELKAMKDVVLDGENGKTFKADEMESGNISIHLAKGFALNLIAKMKSDASASNGATVLGSTLNAFLSDPQLNEIGLGFLSSAIRVSSAKSNLKGTVNLDNDQVNTLVGLAMEAGGAMLQQSSASVSKK